MSEKPTIHLPQEDGVHHGILYIEGMDLTVNWIDFPWRGDESVEKFAAIVTAFLAGNDRYLVFESPHDGRRHYLTRRGVENIQMISQGKTVGWTEPRSENVNLKRIHVPQH